MGFPLESHPQTTKGVTTPLDPIQVVRLCLGRIFAAVILMLPFTVG